MIYTILNAILVLTISTFLASALVFFIWLAIEDGWSPINKFHAWVFDVLLRYLIRTVGILLLIDFVLTITIMFVRLLQ